MMVLTFTGDPSDLASGLAGDCMPREDEFEDEALEKTGPTGSGAQLFPCSFSLDLSSSKDETPSLR